MFLLSTANQFLITVTAGFLCRLYATAALTSGQLDPQPVSHVRLHSIIVAWTLLYDSNYYQTFDPGCV